MRAFLTLSLFCIFPSLFGQTKIYNNTKINKAENVYVKSGNNILIKTNNITIGKIIINQTVKPSTYVTQFNQILDTNKFYRTTIGISNPDNLPLVALNIKLQFDNAVDSVIAAPNGIEYMSSWRLNGEKTQFQYNAGQIIGNLFFFIYSKKKIFTQIYGVDGTKLTQ